jgi:hypothetical protein
MKSFRKSRISRWRLVNGSMMPRTIRKQKAKVNREPWRLEVGTLELGSLELGSSALGDLDHGSLELGSLGVGGSVTWALAVGRIGR